MTKHFECTACGKCCYGLLPLTCKDALANASRFPLCFVWTAVQENHRDFSFISSIGIKVKLIDNKQLAVQIVPTSFIPSKFPCPALLENNLCGIQSAKPSRCRTMPFYPYRDEKYQADLLNPREGWACKVSEDAPVVYQDKKIVFREDFDQEKSELLEQVSLLRRYAEYMQKYTHSFNNRLAIASMKQKGNTVVTSLSSFLTATKNPNARQIAEEQLPVLNDYIAKTANDPDLADFHRHYVSWAKEMSYLAKSSF